MEIDIASAVPVDDNAMSVPADRSGIDFSTAMPKDSDISMHLTNGRLEKAFTDMKIWKRQAKPDVAGQMGAASVAFAVDSTVNFAANNLDIIADMNDAVIEKNAEAARVKRADPNYNWMLDMNYFRDSMDISVSDRNKGFKKETIFDSITKSTNEFLQKNFPQKPGAVNEWTYKLTNGSLSVLQSIGLMKMATALGASRLAQAMTPAGVIGAQQAAGVSEEAEAKGMPMGTRLEVYMQDFVAQGGIEAIGMDFLKNGLRGVKMAERIAIDATNNAMQEGLQSLSEDGIRIMNGISYESMSQVAQKAADNAVVGAIIGGGSASIGYVAENRSIVGDFRKFGLTDKEIDLAVNEVMNGDYVVKGQLAEALMQKGMKETQASGAEKVMSDYGNKQLFKTGIGQIITDLKKRGLNTADAAIMSENLIKMSVENVGKVIEEDLKEAITKINDIDGYEAVYLDVLQKQLNAGRPEGIDELSWVNNAIQTAKLQASIALAEGKKRNESAMDVWKGLGAEIKLGDKETKGALKQKKYDVLFNKADEIQKKFTPGGESFDNKRQVSQSSRRIGEMTRKALDLYKAEYGDMPDIQAMKALEERSRKFISEDKKLNQSQPKKSFELVKRKIGGMKDIIIDGKVVGELAWEPNGATADDFTIKVSEESRKSGVATEAIKKVFDSDIDLIKGRLGFDRPVEFWKKIGGRVVGENVFLNKTDFMKYYKSKDGVLYQSAASGGLVAMHNIKAEGLIHAEKMGGLAVPSLSIGKAKHPLEGFGEITLIGSKELIDPSRASTKVFNADIYSPRYPSVKYDFDTKGLKEARETVKKEEKDLGRQLGSDLDSGSFSRKGKEALYDSAILRLKYLRSIGQDVVVPKKAPKLEYLSLNPEIEKFVNTWNPPSDLYSNQEFRAEYEKLRQAVMDDVAKKDVASGSTGEEATALANEYGKMWYEDDGNPNYNIIRQLMNEADEKKNAGTPDYYAAERLISDEIRKDSKSFQEWVDKNYLGIIGKERLYNGEDRNYNARYLAHTLENVVRVMKRELQGGESFNYGAPSVRASVAKRYATIKQIQGDRDKILSKEDFKKIKDISDQEFEEILGQAYDVAKNKEIGAGDRFVRVLIDGIKNRNIEGELKEYGFEGMDIGRIRAWLENARNMPTEYFEAKLQRAVSLSEFSGAVVPLNTPDKAIRVLERNNIPYIKYDEKIEGDRARAIKEMSEKQGVLFQGKVNPRAQVDMTSVKGKKIITIFKTADQTSLVHEFSHIWFQDMFDYVNSGAADEAYIQHFSTVKNWLGLEEGQRNLTTEQQERFAQGFESFLREGNAPIGTDLQAAFDAFRKWMIKIYKTPEVLGEKLTPAVKDFYARMMGGERAQTNDEIMAERESSGKDISDIARSLTDEEASLISFQEEQNEMEAQPIRDLYDLLMKTKIEQSEINKGEWADTTDKTKKFFSEEGKSIDDLAATWFQDHPREDEIGSTPANEFRQLIINTFVNKAGHLADLNRETRVLRAILNARKEPNKADLGDVSEEEILGWAKQNAERVYDENLVENRPIKPVIEKFQITMKQWLRDREKAARGGFKAGEESASEKFEKIVNILRWTIKDIKRVKKDVSDYAKAMLPAYYGKRVYPLINSANNQDDLIKAFIRINEMRDKSIRDEAINNLRDLIGKIADNESIDIGYKAKALAMMDDIELKKHSDETMGRIQEMKKAVDKGASVTPEMAEEIAILSRRDINSLTLSQIQGYQAKLEALLNMARVKFRVRKEARQLRKEVMLMALAGGTKKMTYAEEKRIYARKLTAEERIDNLVARMKNIPTRIGMALTPIDVLFDELDGSRGTFDGVNFKTFKSVIDAAFGRYLDLKDRYQMPIIKLAQELKIDQQGFERIGIYAVMQQDKGMEKLKATLDPKQLQEAENIELTDAEMKWYTEARKMLDVMRSPIEKVMYEEFNKVLDRVKSYFPFVTDWTVLSEAEIQDRMGQYAEGAIDKALSGIKRSPRKGFSITRTGGSQKINLNAFDVFMKHSDDVAYLVEMTKDLKLVSDIAADEKYGEIAGDRGQAFVRSWLDLIARKGGVQEARKIAVLDTIRRNIGAGTLGFKLTSMLVQPTSLADASGRIGGDWVMRGVSHIMDKNWVKLIMQMPEIRRRAGDDPAYADFINGLNDGDFIWLRKLQEKGMRPLQYLDMLSAMATAAGSYEKHMEKLGRPIDFENIDKQAMEQAQLDVRRSQSSGFFKDAPLMSTRGALTGNVSLDKFLAQFNNFIMTRFSTAHEIKAEFKRGDVKMLANRMSFFIVSTLAIMGIRGGIVMLKDIILDDDKDYEWDKSLWNEVFGNIPLVGNTLASWATGREASVPIPGVSAVGDIVKSGGGMFTAKKGVTKAKNAVRFAGAVGRISGIPTMEAQDIAVRAIGASSGGRKRTLRKVTKRRKINRRIRRME